MGKWPIRDGSRKIGIVLRIWGMTFEIVQRTGIRQENDLYVHTEIPSNRDSYFNVEYYGGLKVNVGDRLTALTFESGSDFLLYNHTTGESADLDRGYDEIWSAHEFNILTNWMRRPQLEEFMTEYPKSRQYAGILELVKSRF